MKKIIFTILPILFVAQSCNFLFGDLTGQGGSGSKGVFLSTDSGQTWGEANRIGKNKSLAQAEISQIVMDPANSKNILAVTVNAGIYASNSGASGWGQILPNFGGYDAFINPNNNKEIFAAGSRAGVSVILKSADSGGTWTQIYSEPTGRAAVVSLIYDPKNSAVFYAGLSSGTILKSVDSGNNWNTVVNFQDRIIKMTLTPDSRTFYVLSRSQGLRRSQDGGKGWNEIKVVESPGQFNDFALEPGNPAVMYVVTEKGLFKSQDSGATWTRLLLPANPQVNNVSSVVVNPQNRRQIFATIRSTVYRSDDYGASWRTEALPTNRVISKIAIDPTEPNRIYVGLK